MSKQGQSTRLATADAVFEAYNTMSTEALSGLLDSSFTKEVLPKSLKEPISDRETYLKQAANFPLMFSTSIITPQEVFEDEARNAVIVHGSMKAEIVGHGSMENEFVMMMFLSEDQTKVVKMKDFRGQGQ